MQASSKQDQMFGNRLGNCFLTNLREGYRTPPESRK